MVPNHGDVIEVGSWANWMWLADPPSWDTALCLIPEPGAVAALARYCTRVAQVEAGPDSIPGEHSSESYDIVVAHDLTDRLADRGTPANRGLWRECHRLLRPGGCLMVCVRNPQHYRRIRTSPAVVALIRQGRRLHRGIVAAGFGEIRRYYVASAPDEPRSIIPMDRRAVAGYERVEMKMSSWGNLRGRLGRFGLDAVLYPSVLYLANR